VSLVVASCDIGAPPSAVWAVVMDPNRLGEWVTIHNRLLEAEEGSPHPGYKMRKRLHVRGVRLDVAWELVECREPELAVWEGRGPARSRARSEYRLESVNGGTHFDYRNEFHAPLGVIGSLASRALVGGIPEREATLTLARLKSLLEQA
jgi:uncharacterized protein YndB with AHSA1/START domain